MSSGSRVVNALIGGWNLNGVLSFNSGTAFDVGSGKDIAQTGNYNYGNGYGYERANLVGNPYPAIRVPRSGLTSQLFKRPLWIRSGTWAEIHFARTGTRIWIFRSSASSRSQNDSDWNSVSRRST